MRLFGNGTIRSLRAPVNRRSHRGANDRARVLVTGAAGTARRGDRRGVRRWRGDRAHARRSTSPTRSPCVTRSRRRRRPSSSTARRSTTSTAPRTAPPEALAVNAFAVRSLARAAEACGATFVHYSTDFVFDGAADAAVRRRRAAVAAQHLRASKLLGEWFALDAPARLRAARREPVRRAAGWTGRRGTLDAIVDGLEQRARGAGLHRPGRVAELRRRHRARRRRHLVDGRARRACITA